MIRYHVLLVLTVSTAISCCSPGSPGDDLDTGGDADRRAAEGDASACGDAWVLWPGPDLCVPELAPCPAPWELPHGTRGCVPVGPRACPGAWSEDPADDCPEGDLDDCEDGFELTEGGAACVPRFDETCGEDEIPSPGGGCLVVGYGTGEAPGPGPSFDACPEGRLPLPGGGCAVTGSRACPQLLEPDSEGPCVLTEGVACPAGWAASEDGLTCDAGYSSCPPGARSVVGGGCQVVTGGETGCPEGPFPPAPSDGGAVAYVLAGSPCAADCGTEAAPFPSIQAAIDASADGDHVLVGPGVYDEGLILSAGVSVTGVCTSLVTLTGSVAPASLLGTPMGSVSVMASGADGAHLSDLRIDSGMAGVVVVDSADVTLTRMEILDGKGAGIYVGEGGHLVATRARVHGTVARPGGGTAGMGLWVEDGGQATLKESLLEALRGAGTLVTGEGSEASLRESTIRGTRHSDDNFSGSAALTWGGGHLVAEDCFFDSNDGDAVYAEDAATVELTRTEIAGGTSGNMQGVVLRKGASGVLEWVVIDAAHGSGLTIALGDTEATVRRTRIRGTVPDATDGLGTGVQIATGATASFEAVDVDGSAYLGLLVFGGATLESSGLLVRRTTGGSPDGGGEGLVVMDPGTEVALSRSSLEGNAGFGARVLEAGHLSLDGAAVRSTLPGPDGDKGYGVFAGSVGTVVAQGLLIEGSWLCGAAAYGTGASVDLSNSVVRDTGDADLDDLVSYGLLAHEGGKITVADSALRRNRSAAAVANGAESTLWLSGTRIEGPPPGSGSSALGIAAQAGAQAHVDACEILGSTGNGALVSGAGARLEMQSSLVLGVVEAPQNIAAPCIQVNYGAEALISGSTLAEGAVVGALVWGADSRLDLADSVLRDTWPSPDDGAGTGLLVAEEGAGELLRTLVRGCASVGIAARGGSLFLRESVVRDTLPNHTFGQGPGIALGNGAHLEATATLLEGNTGLGLLLLAEVGGEPATAAVHGSVVRGTIQGAADFPTAGIHVAREGALTVTASLIEDNVGGGITVTGSAASIDAERCVVRDSVPDLDSETAYGLYAADGAWLRFDGGLVARATGAGAASFDPDTNLHLRGSIVRDSGHEEGGTNGFGVAVIEHGYTVLDHDLIVENTTTGVTVSGASIVEVHDSFVGWTRSGGATVEKGSERDGVEAESQAFGDGIAVVGAGQLEMTGTTILGNQRCGIYVDNAFSTLCNSLISGNDAYGLAMQEAEALVSYEACGNRIIGNASGLPEGYSAEVTTAPNSAVPAPQAPILELLDEAEGSFL